MTEGAAQTAAGSGAAIAVLRAPQELDLATADGLATQGCAIAGHAGLLLLDLTSLSFATLVGSAPSSGSPTRPTGPDAAWR